MGIGKTRSLMTRSQRTKTDVAVHRRAAWIVFLVALAVLIADQTLKIWVKTNFYLGESLEIFPWWELKFIENNGMAFGMELWNKFVLTFGRIAAVIFFIWIISKVIRERKWRTGFLVSLALITAGAAGNIIDCVFYGELFSAPMPPAVAEFLPPGGGYAGWFEGRVVDMMYFPIVTWTWPSWLPFIGGTEFEFFQYIFNIADAAICVGVAMLIFFYSKDASMAYALLWGDSEKDKVSGNGSEADTKNVKK